MDTENYYLDRVDFINNLNEFIIHGWCFKLKHAESMLFVTKSGEEILIPRDQWGLPSSDIQNAHGDELYDVRFEITLEKIKNYSFEEILHGKLKIVHKHEVFYIFITNKYFVSTEASKKKIGELKVGIGFITYNRVEILKRKFSNLIDFTDKNHEIFVADDGSDDGSKEFLSTQKGISFISCKNKGISHNKNRALFYLKDIMNCDVIIILEDDTYPIRKDWEIPWIVSSLLYGHSNFAPPWFNGFIRGDGTWRSPWEISVVTAQCSAFLSEAISYVGYFDPRFGKYGHEHVEHTDRLIKLGFGGYKNPNKENIFFLLGANDSLEILESTSYSSQEEIDKNGAIFEAIKSESAYRSPWRSNNQSLLEFKEEMQNIIRNH
ncbi:glycosyltransferase family 2 protein [Swingsia samuiensis]|uniref:Glycosyltransferase family 2 protein n=1 Tax=Swingsia samuiensis TaxID=1293412 RepID=A0A4Y6UJS3_9PROT|nr:glycosyltransferase [Swingsia samuiensis]QDH17869.1 glycosyltransferase family 2 protein [Swingsia samuiensis]